MVTLGTGSLLVMSMQDPLLLLHGVGVPTERLHVSISVVHVGVVACEAALVAVDVRVASCAVHLIVNRLAWASLATATGNVLWGNALVVCFSKTAASHSRCWIVHD